MSGSEVQITLDESGLQVGCGVGKALQRIRHCIFLRRVGNRPELPIYLVLQMRWTLKLRKSCQYSWCLCHLSPLPELQQQAFTQQKKVYCPIFWHFWNQFLCWFWCLCFLVLADRLWYGGVPCWREFLQLCWLWCWRVCRNTRLNSQKIRWAELYFGCSDSCRRVYQYLWWSCYLQFWFSYNNQQLKHEE